MEASVLRFSLLAALATSLAACSGSEGDDTGNTDNSTNAGSCEPTGDIPCYEGLAEPCKNFDSGWEGDEYCLEPPDPSVGFQAHVGPADYDDPAQTDKYVILPGQETNWAEIVTSQNTETLFTRGYHSHMRPGSHHFIMYGLNQTTASTGPTTNGSGTESAVGALDGVFLGGATRAVQNIDTKGTNPEDQGIGSEVMPNRSIAMNMHFINTGETPLLQELWVNFILIPESEVTQYVKPITWYGGVGMAVPPGAHETLRSGGCAAPENVRVGMMTGHVHANTLRITTTQTPAGATAPITLFEDYDWHEPTEWRYRRDIQNPLPDATTKMSGGASGIINAALGDQFAWECEIQNQSNVTLTFSNKVYEGEMCNVFGYYFTQTRTASPWVCFF